MKATLPFLYLFCALSATSLAGDWPMWGRDHSRNMISEAQGLPSDFDPGKPNPKSEEIDPATTKNILWIAKLGSQSYGNPTIAGGKVFVGTNNESPRDPETKGDRGILMCFSESEGEFLWQLAAPKLGAGKVSDWEYIGICSSPAIDGERAYLVTNRGEAMCLDVNGLKDGNGGPFQDEGRYRAGPGRPAVETNDYDADILWKFDIRDELGVFPHNITSCSPLVVGERVYVTTSNGVDWSHTNIPAPFSPSFIVLDKNTGELLGEDAAGVSQRCLHAGWSSPTYGEVNGEGILIWGGSDGWCYGFDTAPIKGEEGWDVLNELWRYDCNPPSHRFKGGKSIKYATYDGPSEVIATPVFYKDRAYVAVGQDPEHGDGVGQLSCIDVTGRGDISKSGALWRYSAIGRTISTVSILDDLVYAAEYAGNIHCLDADTGEPKWVYETNSRIWGSTLAADGKVYIGTEDGDLVILKAGTEKELIDRIHFGSPIYSSPVEANGVLYVASQSHLYAIRKQEP